MDDAQHILISLEERYAEGILKGQKQVEFRRRPMSVTCGTVVWMYAKKPRGAIVGYVRVKNLYELAPSTLWKRFSTVSGLTKQEFFEYLGGVDTGFALGLEKAERILEPIPLEVLRSKVKGFHPPQFFMRINPGSRLMATVVSGSKRLGGAT